MHRVLVAHPGFAAAALAEPPGTEATLTLLENLLGILLAGGLDPQDAAWAADIFAQLVNYAAIEADTRRTDIDAQADELYRNFATLPADRYPLITTHAARLVAGDSEERFHVAIDIVIEGLLARASRR